VASKSAKAEIPAPIIVKRIVVEGGGGHHGGAWKVAYADFVTAMMAFFLLMWLLGATEEDQRKGIADYFSPTLVQKKQKSAGGTGLFGGSSIVDSDAFPGRAAQTGNRALTVPVGAKGGDSEGGGDRRSTGKAERPLDKAVAEIRQALQARADLRAIAAQVMVTRTPDGIRIDLVDDAAFSMFKLGTTLFEPEAEALIGVIGKSLADGHQKVRVRGHTDALRFAGGGAVNNWTLSSGRAEATRRVLVLAGVADARITRIEGVSDREPLNPKDLNDPRNRRVSIEVTGR
jgi:chemotaxis protein MotB